MEKNILKFLCSRNALQLYRRPTIRGVFSRSFFVEGAFLLVTLSLCFWGLASHSWSCAQKDHSRKRSLKVEVAHSTMENGHDEMPLVCESVNNRINIY